LQLPEGKDRENMKAIFLDRDGVINELVYHQEQGIIDSPSTVEQFTLLPGVGEAIKRFHEEGYKVVVISNQPGIAKGNLLEKTFQEIRSKMKLELAREGAYLDAEYYCFHHPEAKVERLRAECACRKPKPGLILQAAKDLGIDLSQLWMIGDALTDVKAGKSAGTRALLLGRMKCEFCRLMDEEDAHPDAIIRNLGEATKYLKQEGTVGNLH
jgi:D-glycero-D-manno-heptose 1,7-bisphosphate phosphatase